jgi:hypothetical protein
LAGDQVRPGVRTGLESPDFVPFSTTCRFKSERPGADAGPSLFLTYYFQYSKRTITHLLCREKRYRAWFERGWRIFHGFRSLTCTSYRSRRDTSCGSRCGCAREGREPAAGCGCAGVAEEGWAGVSDAGEPDAAGTDAEGFGGAVGGGSWRHVSIKSLRERCASPRIEGEDEARSLRLRKNSQSRLSEGAWGFNPTNKAQRISGL